MCCFASPIQDVHDTQIFARLSGKQTQFLVYQMHVSSKVENAMILPLPVATPVPDDAVRFIDLQGYRGFFDNLQAGFPRMPGLLAGSKALEDTVSIGVEPPLPVAVVGNYVASFVPSVKDFRRLDPRFSISPEVWAEIPGYADFGFAVFRLAATSGTAHPMAFEFRTRFQDQIFFPTVHIHDGRPRDVESFDHSLFLQDAAYDAVVGEYEDSDVPDDATGFVRSDRPAAGFAAPDRSEGILLPDLLVHRRELRGAHPNADQLAGLPQASIVSPRMRRWGVRGGALILGAVGVGLVVARRRKLARYRS